MRKRHIKAPPAFHVMIKPRGPICNLDCKYCYYLSKQELYPGSPFRMPDDVLESFVRQYIEAQRVPEVTFGWQGGEPLLMGLDFFQRVVELQTKYAPPGMTVKNALQTNGVLIDEAWCDFFRQHNFLIGISLDGPRELHDAYRLDRGQQPTFERVMRGLRQLQSAEVEYNLLTTVHAANGDHPLEVYRFFRDEIGARFMQFIPVVQRDPANPGQALPYSVKARQYGQFLIEIFDEWVRQDVGQVFVQIFDVALSAWLGQNPSLCIFSETCGQALAIEHNGDLYSCDHFVNPENLLGNIIELPMRDMVASGQQRRFGQDKRDTLPEYCRSCEVRFTCNGGCPKNRFIQTPDGESGLNYLCEGYKAFFTHIDGPMRFMAEALKNRQPPALVISQFRDNETADLP
jgi:uncharacterized protein